MSDYLQKSHWEQHMDAHYRNNPGGCICGHRLSAHKETMPGKVLCLGCLREEDNRAVIGCEVYRLKDAHAI